MNNLKLVNYLETIETSEKPTESHTIIEIKHEEEDGFDVLFQPSLTVMDDSNNDNNVVKDLYINKDLFFEHSKINPWKVGNTIVLYYNSNIFISFFFLCVYCFN